MTTRVQDHKRLYTHKAYLSYLSFLRKFFVVYSGSFVFFSLFWLPHKLQLTKTNTVSTSLNLLPKTLATQVWYNPISWFGVNGVLTLSFGLGALGIVNLILGISNFALNTHAKRKLFLLLNQLNSKNTPPTFSSIPVKNKVVF